MTTEELFELFKQTLDALYSCNVERQSREGDTDYMDANLMDILETTRGVRARGGLPAMLTLTAEYGGEVVELRLSLDYRIVERTGR